MVSEIYSELQSLAAELLPEFSQGTITYIHPGTVSGDADEPTQAPPTDYPFESVMRGVKAKYVDGSNVVASDRQVTMPGNLVEAEIGGFVEAGGKRHKVVYIDRKPPIGPAVVFILVVKK